MKLCKDCKHIVLEDHKEPISYEYAMCGAEPCRSPVDGELESYCIHARRKDGPCGYEARCWEAKE